MRRAPQWLLPVSAVFLLAGCGSNLRLTKESTPAYLPDLRAQFYAEYPSTPYKDNVDRGEVVKGMDRFGVLASWGYPERRTRQGLVQERWVYVVTDEASGDSIEYMLAFKNGVLKNWNATRWTTGMIPLRPQTKHVDPPDTKTDAGGKDIPQN